MIRAGVPSERVQSDRFSIPLFGDGKSIRPSVQRSRLRALLRKNTSAG